MFVWAPVGLVPRELEARRMLEELVQVVQEGGVGVVG